MSLGTSLRASFRLSLAEFGEAITHYPIASATVGTNDEGEISVSSWGSGIAIVGMVTSYTEDIAMEEHGEETHRSADITIRDDVDVQEQDRFNFNSLNWLVVNNVPIREGGTVVGQTIRVVRDTRS